MLLELLHVLGTPAPFFHRRLGYVGDSVRLAARSRRCRAAWAPHLAATRAVILKAVAACACRDTVVVLGSGHLLDVPLSELASAFARVVLIDAVHPWRARRAAGRHGNVALATDDLSGTFALLAGRSSDVDLRLPPVCLDERCDLIVSANLLSQLPIRPVDRLEGSRRGFGTWCPADGDRFGRRIVAGHLAALAGTKARICLITDVDEVEQDDQGRLLDRIDLLYGVRLPQPDESWDWLLAPLGEIAGGRALTHRVVAFLDWRL